MKRTFTIISVVIYLLILFPCALKGQSSPLAPNNWSIVASYTIPGKASGLAWDGTYIYFGIYGSNGNEVYKFNPSTGTSVLQCTGSFDDAYGMTYKSPNLVTISQPSSSSQPANALEFSMSGTTVSSLALPNHYMSGIAWDNGTWWVCTYYPDPGTIYNLSATGSILSQFTPPANQPWDICMEGNSLWIADYYSNMLYKVSASGTVIESHPCANQNPAGVVFDGTYLWYCDGPLGSNSTLYKVNLSGSGTPEINVLITEHDYGAVPIGQSETWGCTVQNTGNTTLTITEIEVPSGVPVTTTFATPQNIAPGASKTIPLTYTPTEAVSLDCDIMIHSNDPIDPEVAVSLTGVGVYPGPHIQLPMTYNYGTRRAGAYSLYRMAIKNNGSQNLIINSLSFNDEHFYIDEALTMPVIISSLETKKIPIWFHPTEETDYSGILTIESNAVSQGTQFYEVNGSGEDSYYPIGTPLWTYAISGGFDNSPKCIVPCADITGDNVAEVIVGSEDNFVRCFNGNASVTGDVLWAVEIYSGAVYNQNCITTTLDIDNDNYNDVIVGTAWGDESVIALSGKTGQQIWKHDTHEYGDGGWIYQVDSQKDFNADGFPDVLAAAGDDADDNGPARVYCLNGLTGLSLWEYAVNGPVFSVISVDDINGDSHPDAVAGASNADETVGAVYGLNGINGAKLWNCSTAGTSVWALMQLDDINADGRRDVAAGDFSGNLYYLNGGNGWKLDQTSIGNNLILRLVDMGDINKNGFRDVLVAHSGTLALVFDGSTCSSVWSQSLSDKSWCVANIKDVTWDGYDDAIIGTLYVNNNAYFLNGTSGDIISTYPSGGPIDALNAIPDIAGDSTMEMLFGDRDGYLTCLSGGFDSTIIAAESISVGQFSVNIFPNPNNGSFAIKITTDLITDANINVSDLQGRIVYAYKANLYQGENIIECNLNAAQITSGIYFIELSTTNGTKREKMIIK